MKVARKRTLKEVKENINRKFERVTDAQKTTTVYATADTKHLSFGKAYQVSFADAERLLAKGVVAKTKPEPPKPKAEAKAEVEPKK